MAALVMVAATANASCWLGGEPRGSQERGEPHGWQERLAEAETTLGKADAPAYKHFYALNDAAKGAYEVGELDKAERFAQELLTTAGDFRDDWNYGNAIHDGHMVLGRLALRRNDIAGAIGHLTESGNTPGSPQLDSFGPNTSLANDLLRKGHRDAVLAYFDQCKRFWVMGAHDLRTWSALVKAGEQPDFGAHLVY